ncbi:MAG: hypothetical protein KGV56_03985 [Gammaproteobacteria bacterium]|nr:hypothetical protein [Gammaproteobacteria bacterium]
MFDWWADIHNSNANGITFFDDIGICIAFLTFLATLLNIYLNYRSNKKLNENIEIELVCEEECQILPQTIKRRHFNRSEVQGVLGNFYESNQRYDSKCLCTDNFSQQLEAVQNGKSNKLQIHIEKIEEFKKFC